ncbi:MULTISPECIES: DUF2332 family protein [Gordonia]|uniref:DUF2332 family protein n=1 Tax=Gordonia TaxID=2053 RepID=UPI001E5A8449|nr:MULTISPECIES: DUF2332 family protein [Gordonia]MDH3020521.1 DUF2332 family protein [Gordonia alkanivorans]MDH3049400.1 DUF2332 family protein [Gordonia alkanivorans]MDJ0007287.1 DUF2332 family protein [Gordonia alkanivorans]MDJ0027696.1 DUF2332 family protein [Gordonia alkanivorans]MDJ0098400.1 DUF2332 family protein [Gordonia alkanivorans]
MIGPKELRTAFATLAERSARASGGVASDGALPDGLGEALRSHRAVRGPLSRDRRGGPTLRRRARRADLDDELDHAESSPPQQISGDPIMTLSDAVSCVPDRALPLVITAWSLSGFSPERRRRFVHALEELSSARGLPGCRSKGSGSRPPFRPSGIVRRLGTASSG